MGGVYDIHTAMLLGATKLLEILKPASGKTGRF